MVMMVGDGTWWLNHGDTGIIRVNHNDGNHRLFCREIMIKYDEIMVNYI